MRYAIQWLSICLVVLATSTAGAAPVGPIAVMPFKNLNQDKTLEWLTAGIAETMIADLRKTKTVQIVERDQLDSALAEIALQGGATSDVSQAVRAGKMLGAKTVVLGSFQRAGQKLRIVARFVVVETGLVQDTAKVTGAMGRIFHLQDQIVDRLLGRHTPATNRPSKRSTEASPKTLRAYELYAMSLTTSSKVQRVQFLKASLEIDPDFSYAIEDLDALEKRMQRYEDAAALEHERQSDEARRMFEQTDVPLQERSQRAFALLSGHMAAFRYNTLLEDARYLRTLDLPAVGTTSVREFASYAEFQAHMALKQYDLALQVGERHMAEFPGGTYYLSVELSMRNIMNQLRRRETGKQTARKELERVEQQRRDAKLKDTDQHAVASTRIRGWDFQRCTILQRNSQYQEAIAECRAFVKKYQPSTDDDVKDLVLMARYMVVLSLMEQGRFAEARTLVLKLDDDAPEFVERFSLKSIVAGWPR